MQMIKMNKARIKIKLSNDNRELVFTVFLMRKNNRFTLGAHMPVFFYEILAESLYYFVFYQGKYRKIQKVIWFFNGNG